MTEDYYAVLMAGGVGSRFWPISTAEYPKQFYDLTGEGVSMLQGAFNRLESFIPKNNIFILTNNNYKTLVAEQLPNIKEHQIVCEPVLRNTAPCILYATLKIKQINPKATIIVSPSDSWIGEGQLFRNDILECMSFCESNQSIVTIGIKPTFPSTGYGYIKYDDTTNSFKSVDEFVEKPQKKIAEQYLKQGGFLWNSGVFIWNVSTIEHAYKKFQPVMYELLNFEGYNTPSEKEFIERYYHKSQNISVDYAILEKSESVYVYPATFSWSDLGSWSSLHDKLPKDKDKNAIVNADTFLEDTRNTIIYTKNKKKVVVVGLENYIVVDTDDTLLVFPKTKDQDIKEISGKILKKYKNS